MKIRWFGHACFELTAQDGTKVLTDPFDESVGYMVPQVEVGVVTISHGHFDHAHLAGVAGRPRVLRGPGEYAEGALKIKAIRTHHDASGGRLRGENLAFRFDDGDLALLHAGDLGHTLTAEQVQACGKVDVLLVPVGGTYTLDAEGAWRVVEQLKPGIVIPMHFRTDALSFPLAPVEPFLEGRPHRRLPSHTVEVTAAALPGQTEIWVLEYV
ncbi:MAG: MBL fold metallo-hydrolase [Firmicutes bacterium]|nr:MBL fold metallo-hydrolase [Bacillota bacterium]